MTRRDKSIVLALIGLLLITSVGAIAIDRGEAATEAAFGGVYVEGVAGVPQYLNPLLATTNVDQDVARLAFTGLTRLDRGGAIVPDLAANFHVDPEGRTWTFEIRPDAFWHDGKDVTADDVVYTVGLVQDRAYVGPFGEAFRGVLVARVDRKTVRFDLPDNSLSCPRRNVSTVAPQALTLLNNPFATEMANAFAERIQREAGDEPGAQVERAFALAFQRPPEAAERASCVKFRQQRSLAELCRALLNVNELVYVD